MSLPAVILVGGLGTRLRPLTDRTRKDMLPLVDRPHLHQADPPPPEHSGQAADVVGVQVAEQHQRHLVDAEPVQAPVHRATVRAGVTAVRGLLEQVDGFGTPREPAPSDAAAGS